MVFVALLTAVTGPVWGQSQHTLGNIPQGWTVTADGQSVTVTNGTATIAAGATVTLDNVTINGTNNQNYNWAGITCLGNATLILKDGTEDTVKGFFDEYPGIYVPVNSTLTIQGGASGTGKLIASSNGYAAGIGGAYVSTCGDIEITGGNIKAKGGVGAAGIGGGRGANCGDINISGGTIIAEGGEDAAGIGGGGPIDTYTHCGSITISSNVTSVTATAKTSAQNPAPNSIGAGKNGTGGAVTIGNTDYPDGISINPYTYPQP